MRAAIGAGGVGLTTIAWARIRGAERVTAVDPDAVRRDLALKMGATDVLASVNDAEFGGYQVVIECVGRPELIATAASITGARGRVVVAGACEQPVNLDPISALLKELTLRFSVASGPSEFHEVIETFATGRLDRTPTIGPTFDLGRVGDAFELVRSAKSGGRVFVAAS